MANALVEVVILAKDKASKTLKDIGDASEDAGKKAGGIGNKLGKAGKLMAVGIAGAVGAAGTAAIALGHMVENAAADEAAQRRLARALRNTTGATDESIAKTEQWISKQGTALGVTDDQMRPALQRMVQATRDVGKAQGLMGVAMDASAGSGKSLDTVTTALSKAYNGNMGALSKLGIKIKDANGNALSFDQVVQNMSQTFGGQASEAANSFDGKMDRLRLIFDETKESIGAKFLPVAERVADWVLTKAIPAIGDLAERVMPVLRDGWEKIKGSFDKARPGLEQLGGLFAWLGKIIIDKVVPFLVSMYTTYIAKLITAIGFIGSHLDEVGAAATGFAATVVGGFKSVYTVVTGVLEGILTVAEKTMGWIPGIGDKIRGAKEGFSTFRDHTITKIGDVEQSLRNASATLSAYDENARKERVAKIRADIDDAKVKIAEAKQKLDDPDLTKDRKAAIKAEIADLKAGVKEANAELAKVDDKTVNVRVVVSREGNVYQIEPGQKGRGKPLFMASGGIVTAPTLAVIGEAGPEAVIPLSKSSRNAAGIGGDIHIHIEGGLDSAETIARRVQTALLDLKRRQGVSLGLA